MKKRIRELYDNYVNVLEPWQIRLAIARLKRFGIPLQAWDDVMQELAILIIDFHYDPEKAGGACERTAVCRRVDNRIRMLARAESRYRRRLNALADLRHEDEYEDPPERAMVNVEIRQLIQSFTPRQQEVCRRLIDGENVHQIATALGHSWDTIEREVLRIREALVDGGFDQWRE